jgi:hypothetical protein
VVVQVRRRRGEWVEPGETVIRVLRIDRLRAEGFVRSRDIIGDLAGRPATLHIALPDRPKAEFAGTVVFVAPRSIPSTTRSSSGPSSTTDLLLPPGLKGSITIHPPVPTPPAETAEPQASAEQQGS